MGVQGVARGMSKGPAPQPLEVRFWKSVQKTENCWIWTASRRHGRYGQIGTGSKRDGSKKVESAHRVAWRLFHGAIPPGLSVLHHCDNPPCVRPEHLFLGTNAENLSDMRQKGRGKMPAHIKGPANPAAKLGVDKAREVQAGFASGENKSMLARRFGVSRTTIRRVIENISWRDNAFTETQEE
jgi:hypothetical protein